MIYIRIFAGTQSDMEMISLLKEIIKQIQDGNTSGDSPEWAFEIDDRVPDTEPLTILE